MSARSITDEGWRNSSGSINGGGYDGEILYWDDIAVYIHIYTNIYV